MPDDHTNSSSLPALCASGVSLSYGAKAILDSVSFCVEPGEIVTILGGSGSGKSTLLKAIIGLLPPVKGKIFLYGDEVYADKDKGPVLPAWKRIGVLFQSGALIGSLTVAENIALPIREFSKIPREIEAEIVRLKLEMVKLGGSGDLLPAALSGGMKKRAALARAMALDPDILFCDEPVSGLDPITAAEMDRLILELNENLGITMVVITHDLPNIRTISDRSIMLDAEARGIIAAGPPEELENSTDPRVFAFFHRQPHPA